MKLLLLRAVIITFLVITVFTLVAGWLRGAYAMQSAQYLHVITKEGFQGNRDAVAENWRDNVSSMIEGLSDSLLVLGAIAVGSLLFNLFLIAKAKRLERDLEARDDQQGTDGKMG